MKTPKASSITKGKTLSAPNIPFQPVAEGDKGMHTDPAYGNNTVTFLFSQDRVAPIMSPCLHQLHPWHLPSSQPSTGGKGSATSRDPALPTRTPWQLFPVEWSLRRAPVPGSTTILLHHSDHHTTQGTVSAPDGSYVLHIVTAKGSPSKSPPATPRQDMHVYPRSQFNTR